MKNTFEIKVAYQQNLKLVMEGRLITGQVKKGMHLNIPLNQSLALTVMIEEIVPTWNEEHIKLIVCCEDEEERELLEHLHLGGEIMELTE